MIILTLILGEDFVLRFGKRQRSYWRLEAYGDIGVIKMAGKIYMLCSCTILGTNFLQGKWIPSFLLSK